jgi:hypothetical protein
MMTDPITTIATLADRTVAAGDEFSEPSGVKLSVDHLQACTGRRDAIN